MYFYYFIIRRYRHNYLQVNCIISFLCLLLPLLAIAEISRHFIAPIFHVLLFVGGWTTATFFEYIIHRFWMHSKSTTSHLTGRHHYHHSHPTEISITAFQRTAMFFAVVFVCCIALYLNNYFTYLAGFCFGGVGYFIMHKILHLDMAKRFLKKLLRYHIYHHCKYPDTCFGVSVPWWDDFFGTVPKNPKISQRIIDFYFNGQAEKEAYSP
ncbi:MAG TPA: sterol desaturase family protein [Flavisolibacter sp.]|nr:sterol desaturase family protein [Flavisolibacter sp.]